MQNQKKHSHPLEHILSIQNRPFSEGDISNSDRDRQICQDIRVLLTESLDSTECIYTESSSPEESEQIVQSDMGLRYSHVIKTFFSFYDPRTVSSTSLLMRGIAILSREVTLQNFF